MLRKQLIDQTLHVVVNTVSVLVIGSLFAYFDFNLLQAMFIATGIALVGNILREALQFPPRHWWDLPLDIVFELGGIGLGAWGFLVYLGPWLF